MMKFFSFPIKSIFVLAFLSLMACNEVEFKNGRVPAEYLTQAKSLTGTYQGNFLREKAQLTLSLEGDLAVLSYNSAQGNDLLGTECQSKIGQLKKARIKDKKRITHLFFAFDSGKCDVPGRELDLEFSKDYKRITLYLEDYDSIVQECEWVQRTPPAPPIYECHDVARKHYFTGTFVR